MSYVSYVTHVRGISYILYINLLLTRGHKWDANLGL